MNQSMEDRITRLEREVRRWRAAGMIVLALAAVSLIAATEKTAPPAPAEILQAKRIELIGPDGKPALVMQSKPESTSLVLWAPDHEHAAVLVAKSTKAALMLMKNKQSPEVFAEAVDQGGQIGITDGKAANEQGDRAALNLSGSPTGFSMFHVVNGVAESRLSFSKLGGALELRTPGGKAVTRVIGSDKGGRIEIDDDKGNTVWSAPPPGK